MIAVLLKDSKSLYELRTTTRHGLRGTQGHRSPAGRALPANGFFDSENAPQALSLLRRTLKSRIRHDTRVLVTLPPSRVSTIARRRITLGDARNDLMVGFVC